MARRALHRCSGQQRVVRYSLRKDIHRQALLRLLSPSSRLWDRPASGTSPPAGRPASSESRGSSMGFNFRKADAWRQHPLLTNTWRHSMPGLGIGLAAFAVYVAYDQMNKQQGGEKTAHH